MGLDLNELQSDIELHDLRQKLQSLRDSLAQYEKQLRHLELKLKEIPDSIYYQNEVRDKMLFIAGLTHALVLFGG